MIYGKDSMTNPLLLPLLRAGVKTHYEGSIDKAGGNADWDWWLYKDEKGEWVLFDCEGAGCIYNFVQHRYPVSKEPTFRFYFDGESEPRFTIKHSQFGEVYPFIEPLASRYIGPVAGGRGPIRVVRSFVPMPFAKSCRITSDIKLEGYDRSLGHGGWGHVVYQTYPESDGIKTFSPDDNYDDLIRLWKRAGRGAPISGGIRTAVSPFKLAAGESKCLFVSDNAGLISAIKLHAETFDVSMLSGLSIRAVWDGHKDWDVDAPFGCFFTNELGYNAVSYMYSGMNTDGDFYNYLPMPYLSSAKIEIVNNGCDEVSFGGADIVSGSEHNDLYASNPFGYLRTSEYYKRAHTEGSDSIIARIKGHGNIVGSIITAHAINDQTYANCEGDVRIHFDGIRTPQIESDGSESYSCYGWGFPTPPECNPASGYDGVNHLNWSMTRWLPGDVYPFTSSCQFGIESGGNNDDYLEHSGMVFYYGADGESSVSLGSFNDGGEVLESYFEGDDDDKTVKAAGSYQTEAEFELEVPDGIKYIVLRRMSDQKDGRQRAAVYVDGQRMTFDWYFADRNPIKRWLEDEYTLPEKFVDGKKRIKVRIEPISESWNSFGYQAFGCR